jgi:hypothetical protein
LDVGISDLRSSCVNKIHHVVTINRVAEDLGADDDRLRDANEMEIEDGVIWSMASENMVQAFTVRISEQVAHRLRDAARYSD